MEYNLSDLLSFDNDTFFNLKGHQVKIKTTNDEVIDGAVTGFGLAANQPYLVCSIKIGNTDISLQAITQLTIIS